ncbi:MAG: hypothetical protein MUP66_00045 [Candidatus Nanohaloarchaeota archaeon QJJ-5]|nr:hypothetical protein [Candidatus Nanohaloarchaeota archaeon QJJ-5]
MVDDIDYDELSDKTISQIKETVEENDIDLEKFLEIEKQNKDRKTLKAWLEERIDEQAEEEPAEDESDQEKDEETVADEEQSDDEITIKHDDEQSPGIIGKLLNALGGWTIPKAFVIGLLLGGLFTAAFSGPSAAPSGETTQGETVPQSDVQEDLQPYVDQLGQQYSQLLGQEPTINHVSSGEADFANLYQYTYRISVPDPNSTQDMTQEFDLYASKTGSHVLQAQPLNQEGGSGQLPQ